MKDNLEISLKLLFGDEGGYVNVKTDRGGATKYGITHKTLAAWRGVPSVTPAQVKAMDIAEAEAIYRANYWRQVGGDLLPSGLDYASLDFGVHSGASRAMKTLQGLVGVRQDGIFGSQTLAAVKAYSGGIEKLIVDYCNARMAFLRSLTSAKTGFPVNGRGWTIRVTGKDPKGQWKTTKGVVGNALEISRNGSPVPTQVKDPAGHAKADPLDIGMLSKLKDPEVVATIATGALGGGSALLGSSVIQWAIAACMVIGCVTVAVMILKRQAE